MATEKEAPKLNVCVPTLRKSKEKPVKVKTAIVTPYNTHWPSIPEEASQEIQKELCRTMKPLGLGKLEKSELMKRLKSSKSLAKSPKKERFKANNNKKRSLKKKHWADSNSYRKYIVFGMNNIYRQVEKGQLCALLVCANVNPGFMIQPLMSLCASRKIPAAAIPDLGTVLQQLLNFKSCKTLGLKVGVESDPSNVFHQLYLTIQKKAPKLNVFEDIRNLESCALVDESPSSTQKQIKPKTTYKEKDYSHLYIMKTDKVKRAPKKAEDFISLENSDEIEPEKPMLDMKSPFKVQYKDLKVKHNQPAAKKLRLDSTFEPGYHVVSSVKRNPPK